MSTTRTTATPLAVTFLTDRWGDLLDEQASSDDRAAVDRLASAMSETEMTFVVRIDGQYGILAEAEIPWLSSDDEATVAFAWGTLVSDELALTAVTAAAADLAAAVPVAQVSVTTNPDEVYNGRIGLRAFIGEADADDADGVARALDALCLPDYL